MQALCWVLLDLPGLLFFSAYTLLVLFWAEIYHQVPKKKFLMCVDCLLNLPTSSEYIFCCHIYEQARSLPTDKLRITYISVNVAVYLAQVHI